MAGERDTSKYYCIELVSRHHHVHHEFFTQQTYGTNIFLTLWYDLIEKCILQNFSRKTLEQAVQKHAWQYFFYCGK